ncbi:DegT/DnrJ/EryC1/StrS family aminotransferase [Streptacidiphilus sp. PAMC 29251]
MPTSSDRTPDAPSGSGFALFADAGPRLHPRPGRPEDFPLWRGRVRTAVRRLAAAEPVDGPPVSSRLTSSSTADGLVREHYVLDAGDESSGSVQFGRRPFRVVLVRPEQQREPLPAVVVCPGRNAVVDQVTGAEAPDHPDRDIAARFAAAGFMSLTLDYGLSGQLDPARLHGRDEAAVLAHLHAAAGRPLLGLLARRALTALTWLEDQPTVERGRVALFGHSLGGAVALHAALAADRPIPLCTASHLGSYQVLGYGHPAGLLPGIARHADLPDLYGALAPAPLQLQFGLRDVELDPADSATAGETVADLYRAAGAAGGVEVLGLPMGHGTSVADALAFCARTLAGGAEGAGGVEGAEEAVPAPVPPIRVVFSTAMREQVADTVEEILGSGTLTLGSTVAAFEAELGPWVGGTAVAVDSGSAALELAMRHIGVVGRVVLTPVNTFYATAAAALRAGATVDFVDLEPEGLGLDLASLQERLDLHGSAVAAVVAMHTGGIVAPSLLDVVEVCRARGIPVIEDAAHAFGSALHGRRAGSIGDYGAFSFYPTKVLTSAEGGAVTARSPEHFDAFRRLRDHGRTRPGATTHDCLGSNWRLSEVHAAVGLAQLRVFAERTAERERIAARYDEQLADLPGLRVLPVPAGSSTTWYKYLAELAEDVDRAALKARLRAGHGVALAGEVYDLLLTDQPIFADLRAGRRFPQAERFAARHVCLPVYAGLTGPEQDRIVSALRKELG